MSTPTPGSFAAVAQGCRCDRVQNQYGRGYGESFGRRYFLVAEECGLHDAGFTAPVARDNGLGPQARAPITRPGAYRR